MFQVGPQAIYVVGREGDDESLDGGSEYSDGASWETVEENEMAALDSSEVVCFRIWSYMLCFVCDPVFYILIIFFLSH